MQPEKSQAEEIKGLSIDRDAYVRVCNAAHAIESLDRILSYASEGQVSFTTEDVKQIAATARMIDNKFNLNLIRERTCESLQ